MVKPKKAHRLQGVWYHPETSAQYTIRVLRTKVLVSGLDTDDQEKFIVSNVEWDGDRLRFVSFMPSTKWKTLHSIRPNRGSTISHETTLVETWERKRA